jgi:hypothetical protein
MLTIEEAEISYSKSFALAAHGDEAVDEVVIGLSGLGHIPVHGSTVGGVFATGHSSFDAIVDARASRESELEDLGETLLMDFGKEVGEAGGIVVIEDEPGFEERVESGILNHALNLTTEENRG